MSNPWKSVVGVVCVAAIAIGVWRVPVGLTESTVKKHVGRVLAKIGARDRIQAVIMAYDAGLVRAKP